MQAGANLDAIQVFKLNVEDHPQSSNVYDSLGEAYLVDGDKALAIANYQRSIDLDPNNRNGIEALKKLTEGRKNSSTLPGAQSLPAVFEDALRTVGLSTRICSR